ncbi:MAG: TetR/AcrR family transcriptional regulator [Myxococcaceae bacterium]
MRADALKNREALIAVAREHLRAQGVSTSLDAIAREAGVGAGTLYRHFPDRDHLLSAALNAEGEELRAVADRIRANSVGGERIEEWLVEVERYLRTFRGLPEPLAQALEKGSDTPLAIRCEEIVAITDEFLAEAVRDGTAREGVTGQDLFEAALMVVWLSSQVAEDRRGLGGVRNLLRRGYRR